ncbi:MAG: hypothetical protein ABI906_05095 [Pseudomonadota bacterium]
MAQAEAVNTTNQFVAPLPTAAMDAFLERPLVMFRRSAHDVLLIVAQGHFEETRDARTQLEDMIERVGDLWQRLIAHLDALDADPDLEPYLSAWEAMNQTRRYEGGSDDRECGDDDEPSLGACERVCQLNWCSGGDNDAEWEHDGKEPEQGEGCNWPDEGDQTTLHSIPGAPL